AYREAVMGGTGRELHEEKLPLLAATSRDFIGHLPFGREHRFVSAKPRPGFAGADGKLSAQNRHPGQNENSQRAPHQPSPHSRAVQLRTSVSKRGNLTDNLCEVRIFGREHRLDAHIEKTLLVLWRDDAAYDYLDVRRTSFGEQPKGFASYRDVGTGKTGNRKNINVFLQRGLYHLRSRLFEAGQDYLHAGLHARLSEQLYRVDMPVQSRLAERDFESVFQRPDSGTDSSGSPVQYRRRIAAFACLLERAGPFTDGAAGAGKLNCGWHDGFMLGRGPFENFARE